MNYYLTPDGTEPTSLTNRNLFWKFFTPSKSNDPTNAHVQYFCALVDNPHIVFKKPSVETADIRPVLVDNMVSSQVIDLMENSLEVYVKAGYSIVVVDMVMLGKQLVMFFHPIAMSITNSIARRETIDSILATL